MTIHTRRNEEQVTLELDGRVDTNASPQFQEMLLTAFQSGKNVVIDFEKTPYISSAGLRVLMIGQKTALSKGVKLTLIRLSGPALAVLQSVGFNKIMNIE